MSRLAQLATDVLGRPGGHPRLRQAASLARRRILAGSDPDVSYRLGDRTLTLPLSHDLPETLVNAPAYNANLKRVASEIAAARGAFAAIDVGANVGDTVAMLLDAAPSLDVLAVEGEERYLHFLRRNVAGLPNVRVEPAYLGETAQEIVVEKRYERGTEELVVGEGSTRIAIQTLDALLDRQPDFRQAKLLKIDTDGFDTRVLRGAERLLAEANPVVLFEFDVALVERSDPAGLRVFDRLAELGYADAVLYDNTGVYMTTLPVGASGALTDLTRWFQGRGYVDFCMVHQSDADIAARLRSQPAAAGVTA